MSARLRNLCTNSQLIPGALTTYGCTANRLPNGTLQINTTGTRADNRVELPAIDITKHRGETLLIRVDADGDGTVAGPAQIYVRYDDPKYTLVGLNMKGGAWRNGRLVLTFDVVQDATTLTPILTVQAVAGVKTYYRNLMICTLDDWNTLNSVYKINYFDGDTRPRTQP